MSALTQTLIREIESASETVQQEVLDFVVFLKSTWFMKTQNEPIKTSAILEEVWRIKDELAREADYDLYRLCEVSFARCSRV